MKPKHIAALLVFALVVCATLSLLEKSRKKIRSHEEPLASLQFPFKTVDASVYYSGAEDRAKSSIIIRLIDSTDTEAVFAILRDTESRQYNQVVKNPKIIWTDDPIFTLETKIDIPDGLYENNSDNFDPVAEDQVMIDDLIRIMRVEKKNNSMLEIALDAIAGKYDYFNKD